MMINKIIGLSLFILLSPLLLFISLIIYIDDGFPIIYKQKRIGINNSTFWIYKFRTMKIGVRDIPTHLVKDSQILYTRIGPRLRKYSIDEVAQLINIIRGDMVFIGPRPSLYNQGDLIELRTKVGIHLLMPGITGWAQVNGRDALSIPEKVRLDEYYLKSRSFLFNLKIIYLTIINIINPKHILH